MSAGCIHERLQGERLQGAKNLQVGTVFLVLDLQDVFQFRLHRPN